MAMLLYDPNSSVFTFDGERMDLAEEFRDNQRGPHSDQLQRILDRMGSDLSVNDLMMAGERIHTMQKLFNIKHRGFSREEDTPQDRMFDVPPKKTRRKIGLDRQKWSKLLDDYYALHGWDVETGYPRAEGLRKLGIGRHEAILER